MTSPAMSIAETILRDIIRNHPDLPVRAEFYRGVDRSNPWNPIRQERIQTDAATGGWFVLCKPTLDDVVLSAWEPNILGGGIIGGLGADAQVSPVHYPKTGSEIDLNALASPSFRDELLAAIRVKAAVVAETRESADAR